MAKIDAALFQKIEDWQKAIAQTLLLHHPETPQRELNKIVQRLVFRILSLYIYQSWGLRDYKLNRLTLDNQPLQAVFNNSVGCDSLKMLSIAWDQSLSLSSERRVRKGCQNKHHSVALEANIPVEILGHVYERCLAKIIRLTPEQTIVLEDKPEVRKTAGIYYTPPEIVDYIVQQTLGKFLVGKTPEQVAGLRILDPACGAGAFLIGTYQHLLDWYCNWYVKAASQKQSQEHGQSSAEGAPTLSQSSNGKWQLSRSERQRILLTHIYGVDLDPQAVEVAQLSLWLKSLEGELPVARQPDSNQKFVGQLSVDDSLFALFFQEEWNDRQDRDQQRNSYRLDRNIKCGNSVIGPDYETKLPPAFSHEAAIDQTRPFDWQIEFPEIMQTGGFDVVIGNPPYIDSEAMQAQQLHWRRYCSSRYRTASGNWDLFCVFIEKAVQLCKPGGFTSLVVPNKLGSADYAAQARSLLTVENQLLSIRDYSRVPIFPVAVYPLVYVVQKTNVLRPNCIPAETVQYERMQLSNVGEVECRRSHNLSYSRYFTQPEHPWPIFAEIQQSDLAERLRHEFPPLDAIAQVSGAATVAEAYEIQPLIQEGKQGSTDKLKVVNSGTIDRYQLLWGEKQLRYLGNSYLYPIISSTLLRRLPQKRYQQATQPKIIIAGMTQILECAVDLQGCVLAGKSTSIILSQTDLHYLLGVLNSRLMTFYFRSVFSGNSLQGGYLRIGPPQLRKLPICTIDQAHPIDRVDQDHLIGLVIKMLSLYQQLKIVQVDKQPIHQAIKVAEQQIDQLIYKLYKLTRAEIEMVEQAT